MKESKTMDEGALEEEVTLKGRIFALTMRLLALGLIVLSLMLSTEGLFVVILLFIIVVPFEKLFPRHKGQKVRRPKLGTDIGYGELSKSKVEQNMSQSLTILKFLIWVFVVLIVASLAEPSVSAGNECLICLILWTMLIFPAALFGNWSKQSKLKLSTNLDIPPPVLEENKEEYLAELDKIREAEEWIENNKITEQPIKPVMKNNIT